MKILPAKSNIPVFKFVRLISTVFYYQHVFAAVTSREIIKYFAGAFCKINIFCECWYERQLQVPTLEVEIILVHKNGQCMYHLLQLPAVLYSSNHCKMIIHILDNKICFAKMINDEIVNFSIVWEYCPST